MTTQKKEGRRTIDFSWKHGNLTECTLKPSSIKGFDGFSFHGNLVESSWKPVETSSVAALRVVILCFFVLVSFFCESQTNLVPNPSFEVYDTCPNFSSQIRYATNWFDANTGTSDYYNSCSSPTFVGVPINQFGNQNTHGGNAYAGFMASDAVTVSINYREYLEVKLTDSLVAGTKYYLSFFVSLADSSTYATDDIGAFFSSDSLRNDTSWDNFNVIPQIANPQGNFLTSKLNWTQIKGSFTAIGGEKYLTIGNFKDTSNATFVSVPNGGNGTTYDFPYYYIDDVCLSTDSLLCSVPSFINQFNKADRISIYPNPADTYINLTLPFVNAPDDSFSMFSYTGIETFRCSIPTDCTINVSELPVGIYYCQLHHKGQKYSTKILIKR